MVNRINSKSITIDVINDTAEKMIFSKIEKNLKKWVEEKRYLEFNSSLEEVANELDTTVEQMRRFFMVCIGENFMTWRTLLRLEMSKTLLIKNPEASIESIAISIGINDKSNFRKQFIQEYKITPTAWRKKNARHFKWLRKRRAKRKVSTYFSG